MRAGLRELRAARQGRRVRAATLVAASALLTQAAAASLSAGPAAPEVRFATHGGRTVIETRGVDAGLLADLRASTPDPGGWAEIFAISTLDADASGGQLPELLGTYSVEAWGVRFVPRFPLLPGQTYVARWLGRGFDEPRVATYTLDRGELERTTEVAAVYPSSSTLPENVLRLYLQFSAPMSRGRAREHIRLLDESGSVVEAPFVAPEHELWSPDSTRLTLFFDPGRIKRGVGPNLEAGPPLERGRSYTLVVDNAMTDASGAPLVRDHTASFTIGPPDRAQPRPEDWTLQAPAGANDAVVLRFPEPLDWGLLAASVEVLGPAGEPISGRVTICCDEHEWSFRPEGVWIRGVYRVRIWTELEDLAGNSLRRPFERALDEADGAEDGPRFVDLPFRPSP